MMSTIKMDVAYRYFRGMPTSDLQSERVFVYACKMISCERRRFLREIGVQSKQLDSWLDIPEEVAYKAIEDHFIDDPREKYRVMRKWSRQMDDAMKEDLERLNHQPLDDDLAIFIYAYLEMHPTSRKDIFKDSGIPLPDHYLQNCWDLTKSEFKGVLRLWHRERGEDPEDLQKILTAIERFQL